MRIAWGINQYPQGISYNPLYLLKLHHRLPNIAKVLARVAIRNEKQFPVQPDWLRQLPVLST